MMPIGFSASLLTTPLTLPKESVPLPELIPQLLRRVMPCLDKEVRRVAGSSDNAPVNSLISAFPGT